MKIAIIGAGAVGAFYGAKLQKSGHDLEFQSKALSNSNAKKLKIQSIWGDFSIPIRAFSNTENMQVADLVIVSTKIVEPEIDVAKLFKQIQPILHPQTQVLFLQNGINIEEKMSRFIKNPIFGGLAFTCINRKTASSIIHIDYGLIKIGALNKVNLKKAQYLVNVFKEAGIQTDLAPDLRQARFEKLLWNVPFNSLSVLGNTDTKALIAFPSTKVLSKKLMEETRTIALHEHKKITSKMIQEMIQRTEKMEPYKTSMLLDFEANQKMEVESILGELLSLGKKYKLKTPHLETIYCILRFYNSKMR
jgi:2-dehydropantoate 2-reductase